MDEAGAPDPDTAPLVTADGSRIDIGDLFDRYADGVYTLGFRMLGSAHDAEDVVQDTFLQALRNLRSYRGDGPIGAWLYRIAYRQAIARIRRRREIPTDPEKVRRRADRSVPSPEGAALARELAVRLQAALETLSPALRAAFVLRDIEGLSTKEVADALGIGTSAVKMRLARARAELRRALADLDPTSRTDDAPEGR